MKSLIKKNLKDFNVVALPKKDLKKVKGGSDIVIVVEILVG